MEGSFSFSFQPSCHVLREIFTTLTMLPLLFSSSSPTKSIGAGTLSIYFHNPDTQNKVWETALWPNLTHQLFLEIRFMGAPLSVYLMATAAVILLWQS